MGCCIAAAGHLDALGKTLTHNRLCDCRLVLCRRGGMPMLETRSGFLPCATYRCQFYRRLLRGTIILASICSSRCCICWLWKSESPGRGSGLRQLLSWQGGVLGDNGGFALMTLDDELRERQFAAGGCGRCWPSPAFSGGILGGPILLIKWRSPSGSLLVGRRIFLYGDMQRNFLSSRMSPPEFYRARTDLCDRSMVPVAETAGLSLTEIITSLARIPARAARPSGAINR